jgi:hypothetical protein
MMVVSSGCEVEVPFHVPHVDVPAEITATVFCVFLKQKALDILPFRLTFLARFKGIKMAT